MLPGLTKTIVLSGIFFLTGCGTIYLNAPPGSDVRVLTKDAPTAVRVEKKVWFKWWGKYPMNEADVNAATIIEQEGLTEARIRMTNTLADGLVTAVAGIVGFPRRTLIVEGNRKRTAAETSYGPEAVQTDHGSAATKTFFVQQHDQSNGQGE
jgi:hypothetical protein